MPLRFSSLRRHRWLTSLLVAAFALRALIPAGYMPGGEGHLGLQICPDGFPAALLPAAEDHSAHAGHHHHHPLDADQAAPADLEHSGGAHTHDHKSWMSAHCVFSAVASAPPVSDSPIATIVSEAEALPVRPETTHRSFDFRFRIAQPRGPPHLA